MKSKMQIERRVNNLYRALFDATLNSVLVIDLNDGHIVDANTQTLNLFQYTFDEITELTINDIFVDSELASGLFYNGLSHTTSLSCKKKDTATFPIKSFVTKFEYCDNKLALLVVHDMTEHLQVKKDLAISEAKYKTILDNTKDIIYSFDVNGNIIYISPSVRLFGYEVNEAIGRNLTEFIHPDDVDFIRTAYTEMLCTGENFTTQFRVITKDGNYKWVEENGEPVRNVENGKITSVVGVLRDIADRKQIEEEYKELYNTAPAIIYQVDFSTGRFTKANDLVCELIGCTKDDVINYSPLNFLTETGKMEFLNRFQKMQDGENVDSICEYELRSPKCDETLWYQLSNKFIRDNNGKIIGSNVIAHNVTQRKLAELELERQFLFTKTLLNTVPGPIFYKNIEGKYLGCNKAFEEFFGVTDEWLVGKTVYDLAPPDIAKSYYDSDRYVIEHVGPHLYDGNMVTKAGERRDIIVNKALYYDSDGDPVGIIGVVTDITEKKQAVRELQISESKFRNLVESANDAILVMDQQNVFVDCNEKALRLFGCSREQLLGKMPVYFSPKYQDDKKSSMYFASEHINKARAGYPQHFEWLHIRFDKTEFYTEINLNTFTSENKEYLLAVVRDITDRKISEKYQNILINTLKILNETITLKETVNKIIHQIKKSFNFDAIGLRLKNGNDFPYFDHIGFSEDFIRTENSLYFVDNNQALECTCGLVISGRNTNSDDHLFTEGGSIWTNDSGQLLHDLLSDDPRYSPRDRCVAEGYMSIALIPIYFQQEIVGLLQLNCYDKNKFTLEMIKFFEDLSVSIGIALIRKQSEETLAVSEAKYRAIVEDQIELICRFAPDGKLTFVNKAYCNYFGKKCTDLIGLDFMDLIHDDKDFVKQSFRSITKDKPYNHYNHKVIMPDGEVRWQHWSDRAIFNEDGSVKEYQSIGFDITDQKRLEDKLRASTKKYMGILDTLQDGFFRTDKDGNLVFVSQSALEILGYHNKDEVLHKHIREFLFEKEEREILLQRLRNAGGKIYDHEVELVNKNGDIVIISLNVQEVLDEATGEYIGSQGTFRDVTATKEMMSEVIRLYQVVEGSQSALIIIELDGTISYANEAMLRIGRSPSNITIKDHVIGRKVKSFLSIEGEYNLADICHIVENEGKWFGPGYMFCACSDHDRIPIDVMFSKILGSDGRSYIVASFNDTSERRELNQKIQEQSRMYEELYSTMNTLVGRMDDLNKKKEESITQLEEEFKQSVEEIKTLHIGGDGDNTSG